MAKPREVLGVAVALAALECGGSVRGTASKTSDEGGGGDAGIAACSLPRECPFHDGPQLYCCVGGACTMDEPDACPDGSKRPVVASNYDQSCQADTDCTPIGEGNACSIVNPCSNAAINKNAYAKYQSDIANAPCYAESSCPVVFGPCCVQGTCRMNVDCSPADY